MTPSKSRITIALWDSEDTARKPTLIVDMAADHPGAKRLQTHLAGLGVNSDATQIKQAFAQGFGQCDAIKVLPEWEPQAGMPAPALETIARACHEANRAYCESIGDISQVPWDQAEAWQQESAIAGVKFAIDNNYPSSEAMHENWMKDKVAAGWVHGDTKDPNATPPTHPALLPYAELPAEQKAKDDIFRKTVMELMGV